MAQPLAHPFIVGERYTDRRGDYVVTKIDGDRMTIEYDNGTKATHDIRIKAQIYKNILAEHRFLHPIQSAGYFRFLGFLSGHSEFNAEVPPQSRQSFEEQYFLLTGTRPQLHSQGYFPIRIETEWDKWAPELRIIFPDVPMDFDLPPDVQIRTGAESGMVRINNNKFWRLLVRIGFRLGRQHNLEMILATIPNEFRAAFEAGSGAQL